MDETKEYELRVVLTVRYAASCRPESIGRANSLVGALGRMGDVLWERGIDLLWEAELPHLVERERRVRVDALADTEMAERPPGTAPPRSSEPALS